METASSFFLIANIKTGTDFQSFGKFYLGSKRKFAEMIFGKLKGNRRMNSKTVLYMEFMEMKQDMPQNIQLIGCTLDELGENCKIITKETFKLLNLEER